MIPVLHTERLTLRAPTTADWPAYAAFVAGPRSDGIGGPLDTKQAWLTFAGMLGHWQLKGFGWWMIEYKGQAVGYSGIHNPPYKQDMEIGWALFDGQEGQGFAHEAALAGLRYATTVIRPARLVSYIFNGNTASEALADKLGAAPEGPSTEFDDVTIWVHPMQAAR